MDLFTRALNKEAKELNENGVRLRFIGELDAFSTAMQSGIQKMIETSRNNKKMTLNVAVNYGGRWDITQAARTLARECENGSLKSEDINEAVLSRHLMLADSPAPDLFIRTGGEMRISNFLLWDSAYSEFYFTPVYWPDFSPACLDEAIEEYARRERRFGKTSSQIKLQSA